MEEARSAGPPQKMIRKFWPTFRPRNRKGKATVRAKNSRNYFLQYRYRESVLMFGKSFEKWCRGQDISVARCPKLNLPAGHRRQSRVILQ